MGSQLNILLNKPLIMKQVIYVLMFAMAMMIFLQSCCKDCGSEFSLVPKDTFGATTSPDGSAWEETDIMIDKSRTSIDFKGDKVIFSSIVKHSPAGDDDAQDVKINIQLPIESEILSFTAVKGKKNLYCYQCDNVVICEDKGYLGYDEIKVKVVSKKPRLGINRCSFGIFTYPRTPSDVQPSNNHFGWEGPCNDKPSVGINGPSIIVIPPNILDVRKKFPIDDLCLKASIDCPGCIGNALCLGDLLRIQDETPFALYFKDRLIAKSIINTTLKLSELRIPKSIPASYAGLYSIAFN